MNNFYGETPKYQKWDTYRVSTYSNEGFYNSDSAYKDFNFVKKDLPIPVPQQPHWEPDIKPIWVLSD